MKSVIKLNITDVYKTVVDQATNNGWFYVFYAPMWFKIKKPPGGRFNKIVVGQRPTTA
ncbi:MAG TPA: hypothetical protein VK484_11515 [Ferruginibacter sp.]|nr:hypothetical protein [Ferruginibacter sp.]